MNTLTFEEMYDAIGTRDSMYEGVFITAVKTTGIFCRPSCRARKPKPENVEFFPTAQEALRSGYRPCMLCKPMERRDETPDFIRGIINLVRNNPFDRIKDADIRERGLEPSQLRRWFLKHHNMTFHAYQRMLRINTAYQRISEGGTVTEAAFDSGYDSLSGFGERYRDIFGAAPTRTKNTAVISIVRLTTPIGPMFAGASADGLCLLEFTDRRMLEREFLDLRRYKNAVILPGTNRHLEQTERELREYFAGERKDFTVTIDAPGTPFQEAVWRVLTRIPYGETRSYAQQAEALGNTKAVRAVAYANGMNRISIIIPCHRVIGADGSLTGYGGGLHRKRWLLDFEKKHS
ncbi:MAG: methylated-DNA--[protein]-cysteine S-methyltransferase [Bacteroidia bacterium]|nr:methylated-DNA--[protein]-cysteine S-methyltransferase [Bacteroidia bacterium]